MFRCLHPGIRKKEAGGYTAKVFPRGEGVGKASPLRLPSVYRYAIRARFRRADTALVLDNLFRYHSD